MKISITLLLLLISVIISAQPIFVNSIPKSGTHLLMKCVTLITNKEEVFTGNGINGQKLLSFFYNLKPNRFIRSHLLYSEENATIIAKVNPVAFLIYRDPRDQICSFVHWLRHDFGHHKSGALQKSVDQVITDLISTSYLYEMKGWYNIDSINKFYTQFLVWQDDPHFCLIRFENLVGPQGGGSLELQYAEIHKIANHLSISLSDEQTMEIASKLFGGTTTFREGKIGSWQDHFSPAHKVLFKSIAQPLLRALNYEEDDSW